MKRRSLEQAADSDGIRAMSFHLLLSRAEAATIRRRAALARLPISVYLREIALRAGQPLPTVPVLNIRIAGRLALLASDVRHLVCLAQKGRIAPDLLPSLVELTNQIRALRLQLMEKEVEGDSPDQEQA
jgi:hypothetical protein